MIKPVGLLIDLFFTPWKLVSSSKTGTNINDRGVCVWAFLLGTLPYWHKELGTGVGWGGTGTARGPASTPSDPRIRKATLPVLSQELGIPAKPTKSAQFLGP